VRADTEKEVSGIFFRFKQEKVPGTFSRSTELDVIAHLVLRHAGIHENQEFSEERYQDDY